MEVCSQFPEIIRRLVVPPDDDSQHRRDSLPSVIFVKPSELSVLCGDSHALEVLVVPDGLEVAADEEEVDFVSVLRFEGVDLFVYRI
jgi:hypothetical protein